MKFFSGLVICALILKSCNSNSEKKDIINEVIAVENLREDLVILKGIVKQAHAGAYLYNTREEVDFLFDSIVNSVVRPLTTREFYNKVDQSLERLRCAHTVTYLPEVYYDSISNHALFFPVPLIVVDDRLYVNSNAFSIPLGAEVIAVNENPAKNLVKGMSSFTHTDGFSNGVKSNALNEEFAINYFLAYGPSKEFEIRYFDTSIQNTQVTRITADKLKDINANSYSDTWFFFANDVLYDLEIIDSISTAVLTLRTFYFKTYPSATAFSHFVDNSFRLIRQNKINNLVIDCRDNGGGFYASTYPVLNYLIDKPLLEFDSSIRYFDKLPFPQYLTKEEDLNKTIEDTTAVDFTEIRPGVYSLNKDKIEIWQPNDYVFKGKVFVITNPFIISAASNFVSILKDQKRAFILGEETAGNYSVHSARTFSYQLPNSKISVDIPTRRFYQPVSKSGNGRGVIPDKYMSPALHDIIGNIDRPLTYILDSMIAKK